LANRVENGPIQLRWKYGYIAIFPGVAMVEKWLCNTTQHLIVDVVVDLEKRRYVKRDVEKNM
jgi:hypothetical protein